MAGECDAAPVATPLLDRLASVPIDQEPFPHLVLRDALPPAYFKALSESASSPSLFAPAEYPGTGRFTASHGGRPTDEQGARHHGLVLRDWRAVPLLGPVFELLSGDAFSRVLLERFSAPGSRSGGGSAIPIEKHRAFAGPRRLYNCAFGLYRDLPGYEISPHLDHPVKIVTFLLYLDDDETCPCPTLLCRPKAGVDVSGAGATRYEAAAKEGRAGLWLEWEQFDVIRQVHGANVLFAFAPNDISYHGVKLSATRSQKERTVIRGFIAHRGYSDFHIIDDERADASTPPAS